MKIQALMRGKGVARGSGGQIMSDDGITTETAVTPFNFIWNFCEVIVSFILPSPLTFAQELPAFPVFCMTEIILRIHNF